MEGALIPEPAKKIPRFREKPSKDSEDSLKRAGLTADRNLDLKGVTASEQCPALYKLTVWK